LKKLIFPLIIIMVSFLEIKAQKKIKEVDKYISLILKQYQIPGLALAIIKEGKIIHKNNYGLANIELDVPVTDKTLFPLFSTTKVISVITIYQLIEQRKLTLDSRISDFLVDLPDAWKQVQIKNLLTHSSGLPDIVNYSSDKEEVAQQKIYMDSMKFSIGKQFDYNQTNFWLLNRIMKKVVGKSLSQYVLETQFPNSHDAAVFEGNNMKVVKNLSYGYVTSSFNQQLMKRNWSFPEYLYGAAGLNMTLNSFIEWSMKFDNDLLIRKETKALLLTPFEYETPRDYTNGLDLIKFKGDDSYGFSGGVSTAYRIFPNKKMTIILLANGQFIPTDKLKGINDIVNKIAEIVNEK
jgi:CubicO group peptidase (beta-lactamase class C family)